MLSGVSLETAANFLLFLNVAMKFGEKFYQRRKLNLSLIFFTELVSLSMREKVSKNYKQSNDFYRMVQYRKATIYIILTVLLFLLFIPFFGGKHNCLHARPRYKYGKIL